MSARAVLAAALGSTLLVGSVGAPALARPASDGVAPVAKREPAPRQWWYDAMRLDQAHRTTTGKGAQVAIIDTALDTSVPELRGADVSLATDCFGKKSRPVTGMASDHGTAMTVGVVGQGNGGVLGVAPDATVRFYGIDPDPERQGFECDSVLIAKQIHKAVDEGADVISMSLGAGDQTEELAYARDKGVVVVMAAGARTEDSTAMALPAGLRGSFAVLAGGSDGLPWSENPVGLADLDAWPTITAPGIETQLGGVVEGRGWVQGEPRTGTSGATAITAGSFALLRSRYPEATGNQLVQTVIHQVGGNDSGDLSWTMKAGYGGLSVVRALETDPAGYPDEYPLLQDNPKAVIAAYPASVYQDPAEKSGSEQTAGSGDEPDGASTASGADRSAEAGGASSDEGGVPVLPVVGGVALLLALAGGLVAWQRRTRRPATSTDASTTRSTPSAPTRG